MITDVTRERWPKFEELVQGCDASGRWLVLTHDNPDPDSIASAATLGRILRIAFRHPVTTAYGGIIGRAENREMVKTLGIHLTHSRRLNWKHYRHVALVDCQPGTGNNQLPDNWIPDLVFDHHPMRRATQKARFTDIRTDYGATATILAEYLEISGVNANKRISTALVYAIRSETQDFGREFGGADKEAFDVFFSQADIRALARIQAPRLPLSYFGTLHRSLENLETVSTLVISHLGPVEQPDIVPEIADLLLRLEGKTWSACTGIFENRLYMSLRTTNPRADAGRLMRRVLGRRGKGGGHGMIAGGWIEISNDSRSNFDSLQRHMAKRLAVLLKKNPDRLAPLDLENGEAG
jgi:nanoRNase/pAp phosphatase (c-di-AMP/oligoRNAs hydrolase)